MKEARDMSDNECGFCDQDRFRVAEVYIENDHCIDPELRAEARLPPDVLPGSGVIIPKAHRAGPFNLTAAEWEETQDLLSKARAAMHQLLAPDGYTLGWNAQGWLHAHLHVIPRFQDEPMWDQGIRSAINLPGNTRPDPWRPGNGLALPEK
jgi:diadenosine tetraphosphate (Ap4A) HIT family hydrolase